MNKRRPIDHWGLAIHFLSNIHLFFSISELSIAIILLIALVLGIIILTIGLIYLRR